MIEMLDDKKLSTMSTKNIVEYKKKLFRVSDINEQIKIARCNLKKVLFDRGYYFLGDENE